VRPVLLAILAVAALAAGCTQEPTVPEFDNPLDPDGPSQGDPWELTSSYTAGGVLVRWQLLDMPGIVGYEVLHSLAASGPFTIAGSVEAGVRTYTHADYAPNRANYYKVRALDSSGAGSAVSGVQAAEVLAPPYLEIGAGGTTASRLLDLFVYAALGDSAELSDSADFTGSVKVALDENGEATVPWDLGSADSNGVWKHVYLRVTTGGGVPGVTGQDSIEVDFAPILRIAGGSSQVADLNPLLEIDGDGVTEMRFAADAGDLPAAAWLPGDTLHDGYFLDAAPDTQRIYGEFLCDFGFTALDTFTAVPDDLAGVSLLINDGAESTPDLELTLQFDAVANGMRFAESVADLAVIGWQDYAPTASFAHDQCEGGLLETVYAQFRNDWFVSDAVSASIQWLPPEALDVAMAVPDTVTGGETITVAGTAIAGTCSAPLDSVEFDGGGGWQTATGVADWSFAWTPATVAEHTAVTLMARVIAGAEADTVEAEVVVAP
jgi:hypothetical protein